MSLKFVTSVLVLGGSIATYGSLAQAEPVSATLSLTANAMYRDEIAADPQSAGWATAPEALSVTSAASVTGIHTSGFGSAAWSADGNFGTVRFGHGWEQSHGGWASFFNNGQPNYTYAFIADFDGQFALDYDVSASGDVFGLSGWDISWSGPGAGLSLYNAVDPSAQGTFRREIVAGQFYYLGLHSVANITGGGARTAWMDSAFDFDITRAASDIPEPDHLALFGLGLLALLLSRKKRPVNSR